MSLGNTLRTAREACGLTTSELAARTHMLVQIVEGLENEDFRRIPAPIYGRGFIKLYCEAVGLDPKPLQAEFMNLFNSAKDAPAKMEAPPVRSRPQPSEPPPPPPPPVPAPETAEPLPQPSASAAPEAAEPQVESIFDLPVQTADPEPAINVQPPPKRSYGDLFGQAYAADEEPPRQSAAEKFRNTMSNVSSGVFSNVQKLPPNTGRIAAVSLCAVLILGLIGWGIFELYKATTPGENADAESATAAEVADEKPKAKSDTSVTVKKDGKKDDAKKSSVTVKPGELKSSGIEVPPLYID